MHYTLLPTEDGLDCVYKMAMFPRFSEVSSEDVEILFNWILER